ncbi:hypothetical protein BLA29_000910 [Euroglyphus maynei]|uniref:Uncharacterized protein n=1 Tax=Euroglyphus maynei TaxID=6958 RepID=A0A1Y3AP88_EURMA|nr:hypothetical protein BLA29_000910 [Euroglyphus maynei]
MADNNSNDGNLIFGHSGLLSALLERLSSRSTNNGCNCGSDKNGNSRNRNVNNDDDDNGEFIRTNYADSFFRRYGILSVFMNRNENAKLRAISTRRPRSFIYRSKSNRPRKTLFEDPFLAEEVEFVPKFSNI